MCSSLRSPPESRAVGVVVASGPVAAAALRGRLCVDVLLPTRLPALPHHPHGLCDPRDRHVLGQLTAGKDEERLAADHDVGIVGVIIHLTVSFHVFTELQGLGATCVRL